MQFVQHKLGVRRSAAEAVRIASPYREWSWRTRYQRMSLHNLSMYMQSRLSQNICDEECSLKTRTSYIKTSTETCCNNVSNNELAQEWAWYANPVRCGIKLFELCTSNGILLDFITYHGKMSEELISEHTHDFQMSERIPLTLIHQYLNKGHRLFPDNYFTTPTLVLHLLNNDTKLVGTVWPNRRYFPRDLACADIGRGEPKFTLSDTGILAVKYTALQDKSNNKPKVVCLLLTDHPNKTAASAKKDKKDKDSNESAKLVCVLDYYRWMEALT